MVCIFLNVEDIQKSIHCMLLSVKNKITIAELHKTKFKDSKQGYFHCKQISENQYIGKAL